MTSIARSRAPRYPAIMAIDLSHKDYATLEGYCDAVLDRYQTGQWSLQKARLHLIDAFLMIAPHNDAFGGHAFHNHFLAALRDD